MLVSMVTLEIERVCKFKQQQATGKSCWDVYPNWPKELQTEKAASDN